MEEVRDPNDSVRDLYDQEGLVYSVFKVSSSASTQTEDEEPDEPIMATFRVNGKDVEFQVDTGATVTVINKATFDNCFKSHSFQDYTRGLRTYTGEKIKVLGQMQVDVQYNGREGKTCQVVVGGAWPNLVGRNWLK